MDLDLNSILQQSSQVYDSLSDLGASIPGIVQQGNQIEEAKIQQAKDAASASEIKTTSELTEAARQESTRKAIAARLGTDSSQPGWIIGQSAAQMREADAGLAQESEALRQIDGTNFLTDPLGWIQGQLTANSHIANYNAWARQKNNAEETARQAEQLTQQSFQTNNALSSTVTDSYIGAMKVLGAYQYNQSAAEAAMQGARWNLDGIIHASQAGRERLSVLYSANSAIMQDKQYQTELSRLRLSREEFDLRKQAYDEKKDEDSLITKYVQDGYFVQTGKQMDPISTKNAVILYKNKEPKTVSFFESGLDSAMAGNKPVISSSPYRSSNLVGNGQVTNMSPAMQQVGDQLVSWRRKFESTETMNNPAYAYDPKDKSSKEVAFNKFAEDQKDALLKSGNSTGTVFGPADLSKTAQLNPKLYNLPVWKNVLEPASKTGVDINDPNTSFGIITSAMREGKLSYADATDLSLLYAGGLDLNNQTRNWIAFGLKPVKSYNAPINIPGTMGSTNVNFTDAKTVAAALNRAEAINAAYRMQRSTNIPAPTVYNQPDMNVTSDINNFPLQYGPKLNSNMPGVKSSTVYGDMRSPVSGQDLVDTFGDSGTAYGVERARRLARERGNK